MKVILSFELINTIEDMSDTEHNNFFGFALVEVNCPDSMLRPVLPYKLNGHTIYPTGQWTGVYFSEELIAVIKLGYKIKYIKGYEFSTNKIDLFSKYVDDFFLTKTLAILPSERFIAKMHLNQLYGVFGRKKELTRVLNVNNKDIHGYLSSYIVKSVIKINDDVSTLLLTHNINSELLTELNIFLESEYVNPYMIVKYNVAIASAVTAYGRIHRIPYKLLPGTLYTDTDSIFSIDVLPDHLIGSDLGLMKDELGGGNLLLRRHISLFSWVSLKEPNNLLSILRGKYL